MKDYFGGENIEDNVKSNAAFQATAAMRDALKLSTKSTENVTYENAIDLLDDLDPELTSNMLKYLGDKNESELVQQFKEKAELLSLTQNSTVSIQSLIKREIAELEDLVNKAGNLKAKKTKLTKTRILSLYAALKNLEPRRRSENIILTHDFNLSFKISGYKEIGSSYTYKDYAVDKSTSIRIRLLHPDESEHITGADLIYEVHDMVLNKVRFVFLQYKVWKDGSISLKPENRNSKQIIKLQTHLCDKNLCEYSEKNTVAGFRFPPCSAFLRPTDRYQIEKERMVSSGLHIPICQSLTKSATNKFLLSKKQISRESLNQYLFETLFSMGLVGSDWHSYETIKELYLSSKILEPSDNIKIYATKFNFTHGENTNSKGNLISDSEEPW